MRITFLTSLKNQEEEQFKCQLIFTVPLCNLLPTTSCPMSQHRTLKDIEEKTGHMVRNVRCRATQHHNFWSRKPENPDVHKSSLSVPFNREAFQNLRCCALTVRCRDIGQRVVLRVYSPIEKVM